MNFKSLLRLRRAKAGQATALLITLLPLGLAAMATAATAIWMLKTEREVLGLCRRTLWEAQDRALDQLNRLFALNPRARRLEESRQKTLRAMQVALDPRVKAALAVRLAAVAAQQLALRARQQKLIALGRNHSALAPSQALSSLSQSRLDYQRVSQKSGEFAILPLIPTSIAPPYTVRPGFERSQTARVEVRIPPPDFFPAWIREYSFRTDCAVSAQARRHNQNTGESIWNARMISDRM